jgi:tetratricopeptide (TPR) repeat protein
VVTDAAIRWLEQHVRAATGRPFFAWVHLFDPHTPYTPPEPFKTRYAHSPYDGEVAFTDQQVGRFVQTLRDLKLLENSLVIVAGDHGEGLGDHGESNHSLLIYGSTMMVPLIFHGPGVIPAGSVVDDRIVSLVDVTPTILDLLGLDPGTCDGISLLRAKADANRAVYLETVSSQLTHGWSPLFSLQRHRDKYIEAPKPEYYDLASDPGELQNLFAQRPPPAGELKQRLAELMESLNAHDFGSQADVVPDADALAKLAALGYVGDVSTANDGPLPDPKDMIADWERTIAARVFVEQGRHERAIPLLEELATRSPNDPKLWSLLSYASAQAGSLERAIECRLKAIDLQPDDANYWLHLADLQYRRGDREASMVSLDRAEQLESDHGGITLLRARHALDAGQLDQAVALCVQARETDPIRQTAAAWTLQAQVHEAQGNVADARAAYERARETDPFNADAIWGLARIAEREGRHERVIELGGAIMRSAPHWPRARGMMARAHLQLEQGDRAVALMREVTEATPDNPGAHNDLGNVLYQLGRLDEAELCYRAAIRLNPRYTTARYNLAMVLKDQGHLPKAITELQRLIELAPTLEPALLELAALLDRQGEPRAAIELLRRARAGATENAKIARALAWRLATSNQEDLRDGEEALRLAEYVNGLSDEEDANSLDTLAAAYAEVGRFEEAVAVAQRALRSAEDDSLSELARDLAARLRLYESGRPYRAP